MKSSGSCFIYLYVYIFFQFKNVFLKVLSFEGTKKNKQQVFSTKDAFPKYTKDNIDLSLKQYVSTKKKKERKIVLNSKYKCWETSMNVKISSRNPFR